MKSTLWALGFLVTGSLAFAQSFTGTLDPANPNDVLLITFTLNAPANLHIQSWGYGGSANAPGGKNAAGAVIPAGGFDPYLTIFSGVGPAATFLASNDDGQCPPGTPTGAFCLDPTLQLNNLPAGPYILALSVFDNFSFAENLGVGTAGDLFIGLGNYFDAISNTTRTPAYAIDIAAPAGVLMNPSVSQTGVVLPPTISKNFTPQSIPTGGTANLLFTVANPNVLIPLTGVAFSDPLPVGLAVASPNALTTGCNMPGGTPGTVSAVPGSNLISLTGGIIPADATCTLGVNVKGTGAGLLTNVTTNITSLEGGTGNAATAVIIVGDPFKIRYSSNLTSGDSVINITNSGVNGASLAGPGFGGATGNLCVNVYAFSPDEQLVSCCSCLVTPNGLASLSVTNDLISNTLTGVRPSSIVVKLVATGAGAGFTGTTCSNSATQAGGPGFPLADGMLAWGTTVHAAPPAGFATTETPFNSATLSTAELASITNRCTNIVGNGSTFGICRSCRAGALGATIQ